MKMNQRKVAMIVVKKNNEDDDDNDDEEDEDDDDDEKKSGDDIITNEEPSESGINWNVRNRPQRQTHLIRFDNISKQDGRQNDTSCFKNLELSFLFKNKIFLEL